MPLHVHPARSSRNRRRRDPLSYTARELRLMLTASSALLAERAPELGAVELAEAERLLEELDEEPEPRVYDDDDRYDMAVDLGVLRGCA